MTSNVKHLILSSTILSGCIQAGKPAVTPLSLCPTADTTTVSSIVIDSLVGEYRVVVKATRGPKEGVAVQGRLTLFSMDTMSIGDTQRKRPVPSELYPLLGYTDLDMRLLGVTSYMELDIKADARFPVWLSVYQEQYVLSLGDDRTLEGGVGLHIDKFLSIAFAGTWYDILSDFRPKPEGVFCATRVDF